MITSLKRLGSACLIALLLACTQQPAQLTAAESGATEKTNPDFVNVYETEAAFEDAKSDLLFAIEGKGLVISYTSHAQAMLDRTAEVAGTKTPVYEQAEIILFCKADLSHELVNANPHNIVLCPYAIAVYSLHGEADKTYLSFREPPASEPATAAIRQLLVEIIEEVI
jgi:uncharacterized protein (DUF302 family)